jgi:hypothetical protein
VKLTRPAPDEIELSVFGAGIGESLVLHLGRGDWMIVDSCVDRTRDEPAALRYLSDLGVALDDVRLVVATHWHDDHISGLSRVFAACPKAQFACSAALRHELFSKVLAIADGSMIESSSGADEFLSIYELSKQRRPPRARPAVAFPDFWAGENHRLLRLVNGRESWPAEVWSLSPGAAAITAAHLEFGRLATGFGPRHRLIATDNQLCVVLWVEVGDFRLLLGADLEEHGRPHEGWTAVLESRARPPGKASVFKVAHHGSPNGDTPRIWTELLDERPIAAVTTFFAGPRPRPDSSDVRRLCARTPSVFCTGKRGSPKRRDSIVERSMNETVSNRRVIHGAAGHIRIRREPGGKMNVDLANGAYPASDTPRVKPRPR